MRYIGKQEGGKNWQIGSGLIAVTGDRWGKKYFEWKMRLDIWRENSAAVARNYFFFFKGICTQRSKEISSRNPFWKLNLSVVLRARAFQSKRGVGWNILSPHPPNISSLRINHALFHFAFSLMRGVENFLLSRFRSRYWERRRRFSFLFRASELRGRERANHNTQ